MNEEEPKPDITSSEDETPGTNLPSDFVTPFDRFIDGSFSDLPEGFDKIAIDNNYYHSVARGIVASSFFRKPGSFLDPCRCSELLRWLVGVSRWRQELKSLLDVQTYIKRIETAKRITTMLRCTPPGVRFTGPAKAHSCGKSSSCLFCYARACAGLHEPLMMCFNRRPDPTKPCYLVVRKIPVDADRPFVLGYLKKLKCAGGVVCRDNVSGASSGLLIGVTPYRGPTSHRMDPDVASERLVPALVKHLGVPRRWLATRPILRKINTTLFRSGNHVFATFGLCRASNSGFGRDALKYPTPRKPSRTHL